MMQAPQHRESGRLPAAQFAARPAYIHDGSAARCGKRIAAVAADGLPQFDARVTGNKIVRILIMRGINVRFVNVRRVSVGAGQKGQ